MKILSVSKSILFECTSRTMKLTLKAAIKAGANLRDADLGGANLRGADLGGADLRGANLGGANLRDANLRGANLRGADLGGADLGGADLGGANLGGANLGGANLRDANLSGYQIPQEGELIVYKKLKAGLIAKLRIPPEAKRTATLIGRKCRAEFAFILSITANSKAVTEGYAQHNDAKYIVGQEVHPDSYNDDTRLECTNGIHFFLTREEAEAY